MSIIQHDGRRLITNLDGSQDEGERSNDEVLASFFAPFAGILPAPDATETRVIAINEGRLIDFVTDQRDRFPALEESVMGFVTESRPRASRLAPDREPEPTRPDDRPFRAR